MLGFGIVFAFLGFIGLPGVASVVFWLLGVANLAVWLGRTMARRREKG